MHILHRGMTGGGRAVSGLGYAKRCSMRVRVPRLPDWMRRREPSVIAVLIRAWARRTNAEDVEVQEMPAATRAGDSG